MRRYVNNQFNESGGQRPTRKDGAKAELLKRIADILGNGWVPEEGHEVLDHGW